MLSTKSFPALIGVAFGLLMFQPSEAYAYNFNVEILNDSGQEITLWAVDYKAKGRSWQPCNDDRLTIAAGDSSIRPFCSARSQKWQRQIKLTFGCTDSRARRNLYYPRGSNKFFARDHSQKDGNKYRVRIRPGDCG